MKLFAFLKKSDAVEYGFGSYNGYVGVDSSLDDFSMDEISHGIDVHGGLSIDCRFDEDTSIIPITNVPSDWYRYRILGFDTNHSGDTKDEWDFKAVKAETDRMFVQIARMIVTGNFPEHEEDPYDMDLCEDELYE